MENIIEESSRGLASAPKRLSQTERALRLTRNSGRVLMDSISLLEERLKPVMRDPNPTVVAEDEECEKSENFVLIAGEIRKIGMEFKFANSRIRNLLERLEI